MKILDEALWPQDPEIDVKLSANLEQFLAGYTQVDGPKGPVTSNNELYVEVTNVRADDGGTWRLAPVWYMTFDAAWIAWKGAMEDYLAGTTRIVWRIRPEADQQVVYEPIWTKEGDALQPSYRFKIYARLFAY